MISDAELLFMNAQTPVDTAGVEDLTTGTSISRNVYDSSPLFTGNTGVDMGTGNPLYFYFRMDGAGAGATATVEVQFVSSASATLSTPTVHYTTGVQAIGFYTDNLEIKVALDPAQAYLRFTGVIYIIAVASLTAFSNTAMVVPGVSRLKQYASALNFA